MSWSRGVPWQINLSCRRYLVILPESFLYGHTVVVTNPVYDEQRPWNAASESYKMTRGSEKIASSHRPLSVILCNVCKKLP